MPAIHGRADRLMSLDLDGARALAAGWGEALPQARGAQPERSPRPSATRPRHFFRPNGPMPERVTFQLTIPSELGPRDEVIEAIRAGVEALEHALATEIRSARVMGRRRILAQSWKDSPTSVEPRRNLRPRFAAMNKVDRITALVEYRAFLEAYRDARRRWLAHEDVVFPLGTYLLRRFTAVPIHAN